MTVNVFNRPHSFFNELSTREQNSLSISCRLAKNARNLTPQQRHAVLVTLQSFLNRYPHDPVLKDMLRKIQTREAPVAVTPTQEAPSTLAPEQTTENATTKKLQSFLARHPGNPVLAAMLDKVAKRSATLNSQNETPSAKRI